jgi:hypothetical protein
VAGHNGLIICRAPPAAESCGMFRHDPRHVKITFGKMRAAGTIAF